MNHDISIGEAMLVIFSLSVVILKRSKEPSLLTGERLPRANLGD